MARRAGHGGASQGLKLGEARGREFLEKASDWWGSLSFKRCTAGGEVGREGEDTKVGCEA